MLTALVAALLLVAPAPGARALTGAEFDAGLIISDGVFFNASAMSESAVQAFLEGQERGCTAANGVPCLKDFRESTYSRASAGPGHCTAYDGAASEPASRIIWRVAQACRINPQVLLVTLQKEQSLITSLAPTSRQYRSATGYGCPDTAPCDAEYYGFYNQVYKAAWQFRQYTQFPGGRAYHLGESFVAFHPNAACGGRVVNIRSQATANLYLYTPYQPNPAALANLFGTGDGCSAYGNRNFWVFFNQWFGPTVGPDPPILIDAEYAAQGGAAGPLGLPISEVMRITENGGGYGRAYQGGSIYWSPAHGAKTVRSGPIRAYYFARGGAAGWLGWPQFNYGTVSAKTSGVAQSFSGGSIYSSSVGTFAVPDALRPAYFAVHGAVGPLGWPTADAFARTDRGGGTEQRFQHGAAYRSAAGGFAVPLPITGLHDANGGVAGRLGWPVSAATSVSANGGGVAQAFGGGSIYASAAGAYVVEGAVRIAYFTADGSAGRLGWPVGPASCSGGACRQDFQYGSVLTDATGAASIRSPEIDAVHAQLGGPGGVLGPSTSALLRVDANGGGVAVAYQNGSIYFKRGVGAFAVLRPVLTRYFSANGASGSFGWPSSAESCDASGATCRQDFEGGRLYRSYDDRARLSTDAIFNLYGRLGGARGALGPTVSDVMTVPQNGGGTAQAFTSGSIYSKGGIGTFAVSGAVRDRYFQLGGAAGALGWPVGAATCAAGRCVQQFEGGAVDVAG